MTDKETETLNAKNLHLFSSVNSLWAIISGLVGPFYVVYASEISGGMEKLGLAFCIFLIIQSPATYFAGIYYDRLGKKTLLLAITYVNAAVFVLYPFITEPYQLYVIQGLLGITNGITVTIQTTFLGDVTSKIKRGRSVGRFNATIKISGALGLLLGGYLIEIYGFKSMSYLASTALVVSSIPIYFIRDHIN